jgi:hypothetical protein
VLVFDKLAVVAELGDLLFQESTIWTTQMSTIMGRGGLESHSPPRCGKRLLLVLHVGVIIDC